MGQYRISDLNIEVFSNSKTLLKNLEPYSTTFDFKPNLTLSISDDILLQYMEEYEGYTADVIEDYYLSTEYERALFDFNGFPIFATAVEHDGSAVYIASPFQETKVEQFIPQDKVFSVDFPGTRMIMDKFYAYGTPFGLSGERSRDIKLPLKSIVFVDSERFDSLRLLDTKELVSCFIRAVMLSTKSERTKHSLYMLEKLMHCVKFYGVSDLSDIEFILDKATEY